jgi:hypothetical protein
MSAETKLWLFLIKYQKAEQIYFNIWPVMGKDKISYGQKMKMKCSKSSIKNLTTV